MNRLMTIITVFSGLISLLISLFLLTLPLDNSHAWGLLAGASSAIASFILIIRLSKSIKQPSLLPNNYRQKVFLNKTLRMLIYIIPFVIAYFTEAFHYISIILGIFMVKLILVIITLIVKEE